MIPQATWTWSPNQAYVISLHADPAIRIWDATTLDPGSVVVLRNDDLESGNLETIYDDAENDLVGLGIDEWLGFPPQQCFSAVALMARPSRMPAPTSPIFHGVVPGRITCL